MPGLPEFSQPPWQGDTSILPFLQIGTPKLREGKSPLWGHTAGIQTERDLKPSSELFTTVSLEITEPEAAPPSCWAYPGGLPPALSAQKVVMLETITHPPPASAQSVVLANKCLVLSRCPTGSHLHPELLWVEEGPH